MSPDTLEVLARAHQRQVLDTYRIYGQADGIDVDEPEALHRMPLEGVFQVLRQGFDQLIFALVLIVVIGLSISGGTMP